jgi:hypothetical protein
LKIVTEKIKNNGQRKILKNGNSKQTCKCICLKRSHTDLVQQAV